jgi:hypothetical protein
MLLAYGRLQRPPERVGRATIELRGTPLAGLDMVEEEFFFSKLMRSVKRERLERVFD